MGKIALTLMALASAVVFSFGFAVLASMTELMRNMDADTFGIFIGFWWYIGMAVSVLGTLGSIIGAIIIPLVD